MKIEQRKFEKPLDKSRRLCYNKGKLRGTNNFKRGPDGANLERKFEKPLDKPTKMWYN